MTEGSATDYDARRAQALQDWFTQILPQLPGADDKENYQFSLVQGDASFRRYFRAQAGNDSFILVDAPPDREDSHPFVAVAKLFSSAGVQVPELYQSDLGAGFLCLKDFGDTLLWEKLNRAQQSGSADPEATHLYGLAFDELYKIHRIRETEKLPPYSEKLLLEEMALFSNWFCEGILGLKLSEQDSSLLQKHYQLLADSALAQPQLCVHRDFHSRNLLYLEEGSLGVIDFQDAVSGPFSYDLVSLLKDCYITWPRTQVESWATAYLNRALEAGIVQLDEKEFLKSFDLMGAQRHLKAIGIFSRLYLRDGKPDYLDDIPRTLSYLSEVAAEYKELQGLYDWLQQNVVREVTAKIREAGAGDTEG